MVVESGDYVILRGDGASRRSSLALALSLSLSLPLLPFSSVGKVPMSISAFPIVGKLRRLLPPFPSVEKLSTFIRWRNHASSPASLTFER